MKDIPSIFLSFCKHKIQLLDDKKPVVQKQRRLNLNMQEIIKKEIVKLLDTGIIYPIADSPWVSPIHCVPKKGGITVVTNKNDELVPTRTITGWRVCIDYRKLNEATAKDHFPLPFMDQMLERLAGNKYFYFLDGFSGCMLAIFHDMIEESVEVFMDDFSVFGNSFDTCLNNLDKIFQRCKDAHLVLNWEKCHFIVKEGIVPGHKVSSSGLEVDKVKIDVISKLPPPANIKGTPFEFDDEFQKAFKSLKEKLTCAPVIVSPNWNLPFELMCDPSDFAIGAVLGQKDENQRQKRYRQYCKRPLSRLEKDETSVDGEVDDNFPEKLYAKSTPKTNRGSQTSQTTYAYWSLKNCNPDLIAAGEKRMFQLHELDELRHQAYENSRLYKERTKVWHDKQLRMRKEFKQGNKVLFFHSKYKFKQPKHRSRWLGPYIVKHQYPSGYVEIYGKDGKTFIVNGHQLKLYHEEDDDPREAVPPFFPNE
ncbi:reverse transcriptase domain-containing protein [Tanacetum coccineum]